MYQHLDPHTILNIWSIWSEIFFNDLLIITYIVDSLLEQMIRSIHTLWTFLWRRQNFWHLDPCSTASRYEKTSRSRPLVFHSSWMLSECQSFLSSFLWAFVWSTILINKYVHTTFTTLDNALLRVVSVPYVITNFFGEWMYL